MDGAALRKALPKVEILVLDDVMRVFSAADIARARDYGAHVIGLSDPSNGTGRKYLTSLGVDEVNAATVPPSELVELFTQVRPRRSAVAGFGELKGWQGLPGNRPRARSRRGLLTAWTKVSGGAGLTELVVAAAEHLSRRANVLVVEAEQHAPVLVSRLVRSPEGGLAWGLARARQGLPVLPEALSGPRDDGAGAVGPAHG